jgi:hypothetical protein
VRRWPVDPGPEAREIQAHALTLQALLMLRESQAGCCWDVPICRPLAAGQPDKEVAATTECSAAPLSDADAQKAGQERLTGAVLSAVLDELQLVQDLTVCLQQTCFLCLQACVDV